MSDMPEAVVALVDELASTGGVVAVALGGSRALGIADAESDWDLGVYYRGTLDLRPLAAHGTVHPPGSWGRLMNGGAWLRCAGTKVDVLLRDLDTVEHWTHRAQLGEFEIDALLGYIAGVPTYMVSAELASCRVLRGSLPAAPFPDALRDAGAAKWRFCRTFSLDYARAHARRANVAGAAAQAAKAVVEEAHAVMCDRGRWVCNEKQLIDAAGLGAVQSFFTAIPADPAALRLWVDRVAAALDARAGPRTPGVDGR